MKIVFLGTPYFVCNVLKALINSKHEVIAVFCAPEKLGNRNKLISPETKKLAVQYNIPVYQPVKIRNDGVSNLKKLKPDIIITAAYGQLLSQEILDIAPTYNIHPSLLPKYRGPAPVQWALINGEKETGVTIMKTDIGMDSGDIVLAEKIIINEDDNAEILINKLFEIGAKLMLQTLDLIEKGNIKLTKQNETEATKCLMLKKEDGKINFNASAINIVNLIKGVTLWPTAFCYLKGQLFKVAEAKVVQYNGKFTPGEVVLSNSKTGIVVACGEGFIKLIKVQLEGGRQMDATAFVNSRKINVGDKLA